MSRRGLATSQAAAAVKVAGHNAFIIFDGTSLRMNRLGMAAGRHRPYSQKWKCTG